MKRDSYFVSAILLATGLVVGAGGCTASRPAGSAGGPGIHTAFPSDYSAVLRDADSIVLGVVRSIEPAPRRPDPPTSATHEGRPYQMVYEYYRGAVANPQVVLASKACIDYVLDRGELDYRWVSQPAAQNPRVTRADGTSAAREELPNWWVTDRRPEQTLVVGERALLVAGCPVRTYCASNDCPNYLRYKLPVFDDDTVDLSGLTTRVNGERGPARVPLRSALELLAEARNEYLSHPDREMRVLLPRTGSARETR